MKIVMAVSLACLASAVTVNAFGKSGGAGKEVPDSVIKAQRTALADNTHGKGFGPQSPRDIDAASGENTLVFTKAPPYQNMNLCNIHFHKNAEHKGGEFTRYAGNGDGHGFKTGFQYAGKLNKKESKPVKSEVCASGHGSLQAGDTIELHYVHTTAKIEPGPSLAACLSDTAVNPQLRVEAQVFVLVNDSSAADFAELTRLGVENGFHQALNIPADTGEPVQYAGSTTGPSFNEKGSPLQVSWSVRPKVKKVDITSVAQWCEGNPFNEDHAHGVRNLVVNPDLLSEIK